MASISISIPKLLSHSGEDEIRSFNRFDVSIVEEPHTRAFYVWDNKTREVIGKYVGHAHGDFHYLVRIHFTRVAESEVDGLTAELREHLGKLNALTTDAYQLHPVEHAIHA